MKTVFAACSLALLLMTSCTPSQEEDEQSAAAVRSPYAQSSSGALAAIKQMIMLLSLPLLIGKMKRWLRSMLNSFAKLGYGN